MQTKVLFLILLSFIFIPLELSAQEYSLHDLFRLALEKSETIKIAEEDLFISEREKDRALSTLLPTLSAFGYHTRYTDKKTGNAFLLQPEYTNEWGLRLDQSFSLSGRELTAFEIARQGIMKSGFGLDSVKEEYLLNIASLYYEVLKSRKALEITRANVKRLTRHRDASKRRLDIGEVTKTVLLRAEAELAGAKSEAIKAENSLRLARTVLAKAVGINGDYKLKHPDNENNPEVCERKVLDSLTGTCVQSMLVCLQQKAFSERSELKTLSVQKDIAEDEVKYAKGSYWPNLAVEGVYFRQENEPAASFGLDERIYGSLKLDFPFFEGGLRKAEVGQAKAKLRQAEHGFENLKRSVSVEVESSYLNLQTVSAVLKQIQAELNYAEANYDSVTRQFQYGLADSIDVIDANTLLVTSERKLANAVYDYQLAILQLQRTTGTLLKTVVSDQQSGDSKKAEVIP